MERERHSRDEPGPQARVFGNGGSMTSSSPGSTLLDRMVARVTEPTPAIPYALTTPAAWAEELHEAVAPAPARVPEVATSKPTRQSAPTIEDTPSVASRIREASSAPGPP